MQNDVESSYWARRTFESEFRSAWEAQRRAAVNMRVARRTMFVVAVVACAAVAAVWAGGGLS